MTSSRFDPGSISVRPQKFQSGRIKSCHFLSFLQSQSIFISFLIKNANSVGFQHKFCWIWIPTQIPIWSHKIMSFSFFLTKLEHFHQFSHKNAILTHQKSTLSFQHIILQYSIYQMFYPSILYIKIIFTTHENNILSKIPANIQTPNSMAVATTNQQPPPTHQPPQTTPTITESSNKFQIQKPQQKKKKKKKKTNQPTNQKNRE